MAIGPAQSEAQKCWMLLRAGRSAEAKARLLRAVVKSPKDADVALALAESMLLTKEFEAALFHARRAADLTPGSATAHATVGRALVSLDRPEEAELSYRQALRLNPRFVEMRIALMLMLSMLHREAEAEVLHREASAEERSNPRLRHLLGLAIMHLGRAGEGLEVLRGVMRDYPQEPKFKAIACSMTNYAHGVDPAEALSIHKDWGRMIGQTVPVSRRPHGVTREPDRRLRIGLVGGDFRRHPSMRFLLPLLRGSDAGRVGYFCYASNCKTDEVTGVVRSLSEGYSAIADLSDVEVAEKVRTDAIDILIDMSGHTHGHRLMVFHHKPAPVQVTWLGYPCTTGLIGIDYRIADSLTNPPSEAGDGVAGVERLLRVDPSWAAYEPMPGTPEVLAPPSQREGAAGRGRITFGSFSAIKKLNEQTFAVWGRILRAVPGSILVLRHAGLKDAMNRAMVHARASEAAGLVGPEADRIVTMEPAEGPEALALAYHDIDIALDTFPYNGMTTLCEAMWMGVPPVALAGHSTASRCGLSLLNNVGLPELIGRNEDEYADIAIRLARDPARLASLRGRLRGMLAGSPAGDGAAFARRFESSMRMIWREYCARQD